MLNNCYLFIYFDIYYILLSVKHYISIVTFADVSLVVTIRLFSSDRVSP